MFPSVHQRRRSALTRNRRSGRFPRKHSGSRPRRFESLEDRTLLSITGGAAAPEFVPGEVLVSFEGEVANIFQRAGAQAALEAAGEQVTALGLHSPDALFASGSAPGQSAHLTARWQLPAGADVLESVAQLSALPGIAYAEPNYIVSATTIPNDPKFDELWGMNNTGQTGGTADADIDAPEAWSRHTGSGNLVVGIIDTGVNYNHEDLASNIWTNPGEIAGNGVDDDGNGYVDDVRGWDFVNNDNDPYDDNKHGTHVAGTIGAIGDNGIGVAGVNWNIQIMALKFLDNRGSGSTADAILAVEYANTMRQLYEASGGALGANIVLTNNSWGGGAFSQALQDAIQASGDANLLFVAAAGNTGGGAIYPARYGLDNIISVAATDHDDALASFSSRSQVDVDLGAPGVDVQSTMRNKYGTLSGTSMASPHAAGVAALVWDRLLESGYSPQYQEVRDLLFSTADPLPSLAGVTATGGRLNADQALFMADVLAGNEAAVVIDDVAQVEGNASTVDFAFTVSRLGDTSGTTTVDFTTADGTATAGSDYTAASGQVVFNPGDTTQIITVVVNGDTTEEAHETFSVDLSAAVGGTIADGQGTGTILNDETTVSIDDPSVIEGDETLRLFDTFVSVGSGGLARARSVLFGPDGNGDGASDLYVASADTDEILRYDGRTGTFLDAFVTSGSGGLDSPGDLQFGPDGNLYVSSWVTKDVRRYNGSTGAFIDTFVSGLSKPLALIFDDNGDLYVVDQDTDEVLRFNGSTGVLLDAFVSAGSGGLDQPRRAVFGPDGNGDGMDDLYVAGMANQEVLRYDGTTGAFIDTFASFTALSEGGPNWLEFGGDGKLYTTARTIDGTCCDTSIVRFDAATGAYVDSFPLGRDGWSFTIGADNVVYDSSNGAEPAIKRLGPSSQAVFTVTLSSPSGLPVTVDFTSADGTATVVDGDYEAASGTVVFDPGVTQRVILVPTIDDAIVESDETFIVDLSNPSAGATIADSQGEATITDDDTPGITVSPTSGLVTSEDLASDTFTVVLNTEPTADVTIGISSDNTAEGTPDVASLTFTPANWDTPQIVTVTGVDDALTDGDVAYAIVTAAATSTDPAYNGLDASDVSVTNLDNEVPAAVTVTDIVPDTMSADSSGPVTINGSGFVAGASVTFTNGSGPAPSASGIVVAADGLSITATVSTHKKSKASSWDVVVANPDASSDACEGCFTVTVGGASSAATLNVVTVSASSDTDEALATTGDTSAPATTSDLLPAGDINPLLQPAQTLDSSTIDDADLVDLVFSNPATLEDPLLDELAIAI